MPYAFAYLRNHYENNLDHNSIDSGDFLVFSKDRWPSSCTLASDSQLCDCRYPLWFGEQT